MEQAIVKVQNLSHRYSVQWAIRDINFEIQGKGIYGLLGSNGAGKSTLMNIMCGVLKQTEGDVFINGINTKEDPVGAKRFIGFLPQKPPLHMELTVEEYLRYCAYLRWIPADKIERAIDEVLEKCSITHFRKRLIRNLSGGYQQRVGIAQRSEEHTSELQSPCNLVCRLLLEKNFFNDTATTEIYTLSLHDALPIWFRRRRSRRSRRPG